VHRRNVQAAVGLSTREYWAIVVTVVLVFFFVNGPIWRNPFDLDLAIFASYGLIPLLVLGVLARGARLRIGRFLYASFEIAAVKYAVTATIAAAFWMFATPPDRSRAPAPVEATAAVRTADERPYDTIAPQETGSLRGVVRDPSGAPIAGALVWVASGLDDLRLAPPSAPVRIENSGAGFAPALSVAQAGQPIELVSGDGRLHTAAAYNAAGTVAFNHPALAAAHVKPAIAARAPGVLALKCTVHPSEPSTAHVAVFGHPFWAITGDDGAFELAGVPARAVTIEAWHASRGGGKQSVTLERSRQHAVDLALAAR
jgi:plastocyanin